MKKEVTYYGNGCPKCKKVLSILATKHVEVLKEENMVNIMKVAIEQGLNTMPLLEINGKFYGGQDAIDKAREL